MKKTYSLGLLAAVAVSMVGCTTTVQDTWKADLHAPVLHDVHYKPVYTAAEAVKPVKGSAKRTWVFWGLLQSNPKTFAKDSRSDDMMFGSVKEAALYDACQKAGASIVFAPRYTITKKRGLLWFWGTTEVSVEGIPANLTGVQELTAEEAAKCKAMEAPCGKPNPFLGVF